MVPGVGAGVVISSVCVVVAVGGAVDVSLSRCCFCECCLL